MGHDEPNAGIRIVPAGVERVGEIAPLFDAYRQFYERPSDLDGARRFLADRLERGESAIFVALLEREGQEVAVGFTQLYPSFSSTRMGRIWVLNDLFVAPEARRLGVGVALLKRARAHARQTGALRLTLQTAVTNTAAQALYEAQGWRRDEGFYTYEIEA